LRLEEAVLPRLIESFDLFASGRIVGFVLETLDEADVEITPRIRRISETHGIGIEVREQLEPFQFRVILPSVEVSFVDQHLRVLVADETDIPDLHAVIPEQVSETLQLAGGVIGEDDVPDGEVRVDRWPEMVSPRRAGRSRRRRTGRTLQHIRVTWAGRRCGGGDDRLLDAEFGVEAGIQCRNRGWEIEDTVSDPTIH
jgi:hypothetical protein